MPAETMSAAAVADIGLARSRQQRAATVPDIAQELAGLLTAGRWREAVERTERWLDHAVLAKKDPQTIFGVWLPALVLDVAVTVDPCRAPDGSPNWRSTLVHLPVAEFAELTAADGPGHRHRWLTRCLQRLGAIAAAGRPAPLVQRVEALMVARFADPELTLRAAAVALSVSPYHLAHVIRRERDTTFRRQLTGLRLRRATGMLAAGRFSVPEVGRRCGFSSTRQFRATVLRETGRSASELRRGSPPGPARSA